MQSPDLIHLQTGIIEHKETLMGLATLCIHVFKASQAMKGSFSRPKGLISVERRGGRPSSSFHSHADERQSCPKMGMVVKSVVNGFCDRMSGVNELEKKDSLTCGTG